MKSLEFNARQKQFLFFILILLLGLSSFATPGLITFQSRIIKPDGKALESSAVAFRLSVTDPLGTCVVYQEDFANQDMTASKGLINLSLGSGIKAFPSTPMTMFDVFNNYNNPVLACAAGGTVVPAATDIRKLVVQFNDGTGWQTLPGMNINATPFAMQAMSAQRLGDYPATSYVRTANIPTCVGGEALHFNGTSLTCVLMGGGSGTVTSVTSATTDIGVATTTTTPVLTLNVGTGANQIVKLNGTSELPAVSGANLTNLNASNLSSGTVAAAQMPALTGDVTMSAGSTSTAIAAGVIMDADINASAGIARSKLAAGSLGQVVMNDATTGLPISLGCANGEVIKFNGSGVAICGTDAVGAGGFVDGGNTFSATATIGTNSTHNLEFETDGTTKMTILANGNVGIGTVSPSGTLHVDGGTAAAATNGSPISFRSQDGGAGNQSSGSISMTIGSASGSGTPGRIQLNGGILQTAIKGTSGSGYVGSSFQTSSAANQTGDVSGISSLVTSPGATANKLIAFDGATSVTGFAGSVTDQIIFRASFNQTASFATATNGYGLYVEPLSGPTNNFAVYTAGTTPSAFGGNVGIGTTTPARLLHIAGPMRVTPTAAPSSPAAGDMYVDSGDSNKLKVYDGSGWVTTGGGGSGTVTSVSSANVDIGVSMASPTPVLTLNSGTGNNQIVKLNGSAELPAVSGVNLTFLNATNLGSGTVPAARFPAFTGDVTTSAGAVATTIAANAVTSAKILDDEIVNADIKATAAIDRSKLANGSNDHVLINTAGGVMSSEAQLAVSRGGTGLGSFTNNALLMANTTGTAITNATCTIGEVLLWSGTAWGCTNLAASTQGYFKDGGNTFTGTATIGTNSNHPFAIETNSTTKMTVLENGRVGIGTTNPASLLTTRVAANGDTGFEVQNPAGSPIFQLKDDGFGYGELRVNDNASNARFSVAGFSAAGPTISVDGTGGNTVDGFGGWGGIAQFITVPAVVGEENGIFFGSGGGKSSAITHYVSGLGGPGEGGLKFKTSNAASPTTRMTINEVGNIGVGTTARSSRLTIKPGGDTSDLISAIASGAALSFTSSIEAGTTSFGYVASNYRPYLQSEISGGEYDFLINPYGGNVGVGTTSPISLLDVSTGSGVGLTVGADQSGQTRTNSTSKIGRVGTPHYLNAEEPAAIITGFSGPITNQVFVGGGTTGMNAATSISFYTAATSSTISGSERMVIDSSGNVGIGSTAPSTRLHASGTDVSTTMLVENTNSTSGRYPSVFVRNYMGATTEGSPTMTLQSANGTSAAATSVTTGDSIGRIQAEGWGTTFSPGARISFAATENWSGTANGARITFGVNSNGTANTAPTERMRINHNGNVGIGTTSPGQMLTVAGTIESTSGGVRFPNASTQTEAFIRPSASVIATAETTASTSYTDLATVGPSVTVNVVGTSALVTITSRIQNSNALNLGSVGFAVSGATTIAASDTQALQYFNPSIGAFHQGSATFLVTGLNPGSNTFTLKYKVDSNTGTFTNRNLIVQPY